MLASKFRHFEMSIFISTQSFRSIGTIIRNNATDILIFKQQNNKELEKIKEEYGELCGDGEMTGEDCFMKYYNHAHDEPYSFLYISVQENPAKFYKRHEELLGQGGTPVKELTSTETEDPFE